MKKVLTVKEVKEILGIGQNKAYSIVKDAFENKNTFPVKKFGGEYRIPKEPFLNWLDEVEVI